eukprot:3789806-Alexandrium_andersonii.AAC.1
MLSSPGRPPKPLTPPRKSPTTTIPSTCSPAMSASTSMGPTPKRRHAGKPHLHSRCAWPGARAHACAHVRKGTHARACARADADSDTDAQTRKHTDTQTQHTHTHTRANNTACTVSYTHLRAHETSAHL